VSIKVLAANPRFSTFDFASLREKADLEVAAQKAADGKNIKFEPANQKYQMQRLDGR
jgi:hypothetical protein